MTEFGKTLREAREAKGLTTAQIAEETHLLPQIVEDLEKEDFHRISAPIYGRGFVKLYCEAVGIEPKPLVDEFMAILNGERVPAIKVREVELPSPEPAAPAEPPPPPAPTYTQPELGEEGPGQGQGQVERREMRDERGDERQETREETRDARQETPHQYRPDYAHAAAPFGPRVNFGRLAILAGGAIVLIVLIFLGGRALYRASMGVTDETPAADQAAPEENTEPCPRQEAKDKKLETRDASAKTPDKKASAKTPDKKASAKTPDKGAKAPGKSAKTPDKKTNTKPATKRTPKDVPPLYID